MIPSGARKRSPGSLRATAKADRWALALFVALGVVFVVSRTAGLDQSLWEDEVYTLHHYVGEGFGVIFDPSAYIANNHPLFSLLSTSLDALFGSSEVTFRLGSVIPAAVATVAVTYWLWIRAGRTAAMAFAFLATFSPLHFEVFRQARGWGLTLLATALVLISSLEIQRSNDPEWQGFAWFGVGCLLGVWTIYAVALPFLVHGVILLVTTRGRRLRLAVMAALVGMGSVLFYWPLRSALVDPTAARSGASAAPRDGFVTLGDFILQPIERLLAPIFHLGLPSVAAISISSILVVAGIVSLWRSKRWTVLSHFLLPVVVVFGALGLKETSIWDRYVSFLILHVLALAALGVSWIWSIARNRPAWLVATVSIGLVGLGIAAAFIPYASRITSVPRENFKGVAELIEATPGLEIAYTHTPAFEFIHNLDDVFLERVTREEFVDLTCSTEGPAAFIDYPRREPRVESQCLEDRGIVVTLPQRRRPPIDVWFLR